MKCSHMPTNLEQFSIGAKMWLLTIFNPVFFFVLFYCCLFVCLFYKFSSMPMLFSVIRKFSNTLRLQNYTLKSSFQQKWGFFWFTFIVIWFGKMWFSAITKKIVFSTQIVFGEMSFFTKYVFPRSVRQELAGSQPVFCV